jgi:hypothetical protein
MKVLMYPGGRGGEGCGPPGGKINISNKKKFGTLNES